MSKVEPELPKLLEERDDIAMRYQKLVPAKP
jgi:hypothetical protein